MSDKERKTRAEAHYRAAARYMKEDVNHPRAKAHMMRWGALRFGDSDVDPRLETYATMLRKYKEFSVYASNDEGMLGNGMLFPNRFRHNNEEKYEEYRRGLNGSKVKLEHFVRREGHGWGALRFGALDVDPRLERYATMLRKYKEFSVYASDGEGMSGDGMLFPNRFRDNNEERYEEYRRGLNGSKVKLEHFVRR
jgi:hypothetical protein